MQQTLNEKCMRVMPNRLFFPFKLDAVKHGKTSFIMLVCNIGTFWWFNSNKQTTVYKERNTEKQ